MTALLNSEAIVALRRATADNIGAAFRFASTPLLLAADYSEACAASAARRSVQASNEILWSLWPVQEEVHELSVRHPKHALYGKHKLTIRRLSPDDTDLLFSHYDALGAETIVERYHGLIKTERLVDASSAKMVGRFGKRGYEKSVFLAGFLDNDTKLAVSICEIGLRYGQESDLGLATIPAYQRMGIGSVIADKAIRDCIFRGFDRIFIETKSRAIYLILQRTGLFTVASDPDVPGGSVFRTNRVDHNEAYRRYLMAALKAEHAVIPSRPSADTVRLTPQVSVLRPAA